MNNQLIKPHILVVDDDTRLRDLLRIYLREQGFAVTVAAHAREARARLALFQFDLMVLDVMMPGETGIDLARNMRNGGAGTDLPILLLTAMAETEDRITGLESGADDYLVKPFEPRELVLRIHAILKRAAPASGQKTYVYFGEYKFDIAAGRLQKNGEMVNLTGGEAQLLKMLAGRSPEPVTRADLAVSLGSGNNERNVDVQITRLRKKIEADNGKPFYIQTVRGSGYALYVDR
jgi:two-component system phosphate regulon response regulator OmpR